MPTDDEERKEIDRIRQKIAELRMRAASDPTFGNSDKIKKKRSKEEKEEEKSLFLEFMKERENS